MARLLGVSRSGYYAWAARCAAGPGPQAVSRAQIDQAVRTAHELSDRVDGAPRITAALAREGLVVDQKTVAASMRRQGLEGISPRKWAPVTTIPGTATHAIPDLVERAVRMDHTLRGNVPVGVVFHADRLNTPSRRPRCSPRRPKHETRKGVYSAEPARQPRVRRVPRSGPGHPFTLKTSAPASGEQSRGTRTSVHERMRTGCSH